MGVSVYFAAISINIYLSIYLYISGLIYRAVVASFVGYTKSDHMVKSTADSQAIAASYIVRSVLPSNRNFKAIFIAYSSYPARQVSHC